MKTDDLIRAMAADTLPDRSVARVLPVALLASLVLGALFFEASLGVRPDLGAAIRSVPVLLKHVFPVVMAAAALAAVMRLSRPEARLGALVWALMLAPAIVIVSFWATAAVTPVAAWPQAVMGETTLMCFLSISGLGFLTLFGSFVALRRGASVRPRLSGALAGLASGSVAAALFAIFCHENNPMFWGVWYVLAIGAVTGVGALLGRRALRW